MPKLIDLSHAFTSTMPVFPGDKPATISQSANIADNGHTNYIIETGMHVGTHIDAPLHMVDGGAPISQVPLEAYTGNGRLIDARRRTLVDVDVLEGAQINEGDIVLILTAHDRFFGGPSYYEDYPELSLELAKKLVDLRVNMLGMDSPSPDRKPYPLHRVLLGANVLIAENLTNLEALIGVEQFRIHAYPVKFVTDGSPVRVVAEVI